MIQKRIKEFISWKTPQGFFAWATLLFGGIFILIIPPLQTPDEAAHFLRAYQISNLEFSPSQKDGITGSYIPTSFQKVQESLEATGALQTRPAAKYKLGNTKAALMHVPLNEDEKMFMDTSVTASYSPIGYIPQALAVGIGRLFDMPPIVIMYLARLFVLIAWVGLLSASIKLFPFKKWAVAGIALLPMFLSQSVSFGVDVIAIGSGVLFISLVLACVYGKRTVNKTMITLLLATATAMVLSKQVMVFVLGIILTLPKASMPQAGTRKSWLIKAVLIMVPIVLLGLWSLFLPDISSNVTQLTNDQNTMEQVKHILSHPLKFAAALFNTFFFTAGDGISQSLMGNFGWLDTPLSAWFINAGYAALFVYWFINYEKKSVRLISKFNKAIFAVVAGLYFIGVCAALYILFSPVAFPIIVGIQGRYLFPCLFLLLPVFFTSVFTTKELYFVRFTKSMSIVLLTVSVLTITFRYYLTAY